MIARLIGLLALVIVASIAAQELWRALAPIIPTLIVLVAVVVLMGAGLALFRNRY